MPTHAAFLRGLNLGNRRITNDELCSHFEGLGFGDVAAFLASGNVVFTAGDAALAHATDDDRLALSAGELYWLPAGPMSQSELDLRAIERCLGAMTIRTARTIERLAAKFF